MKQLLSKFFKKRNIRSDTVDSVKIREPQNEIHECYLGRDVVSNTYDEPRGAKCPQLPQNAGGVIVSGMCGSNVKWVLYENGQLVISGNGSMNDYRPNTYDDGKKVAPWYSHCSNILSIEIKNGISHIGKWSFAYCRNLTKVDFCGLLDEIPWGAFAFAEKLERITIPNGVNRIAADAFMDCHALRSVSLPNGVAEIGESAFYSCYALSEIELPNTLTDIDSYAFAFCGQLTRLRIPRSVIYIHEKAFFKSGVKR